MPVPAAIYCSTLSRARETIVPFAKSSGSEVIYLDDLAEWYGGEWEFKEFEELLALHPGDPGQDPDAGPVDVPGSRGRVVRRLPTALRSDAIEGALEDARRTVTSGSCATAA